MIDLREVSKAFNGQPVIESLSLMVDSGERVAICGPSGKGKTTLLRLIAGLEAPDAGEIRIAGALASTPEWQLEPWKRKVGFAFQKPAPWPHLTVAQNVAFGLHQQPAKESRRRVELLLEQVGLSGMGRFYPVSLSGGEARRLELARALAPTPSILLLDEPFAHLDSALRGDLETLLLEHLAHENSTLLLVTHDPDEAHRICQRVIPIGIPSERGSGPAQT